MLPRTVFLPYWGENCVRGSVVDSFSLLRWSRVTITYVSFEVNRYRIPPPEPERAESNPVIGLPCEFNIVVGDCD